MRERVIKLITHVEWRLWGNRHEALQNTGSTALPGFHVVGPPQLRLSPSKAWTCPLTDSKTSISSIAQHYRFGTDRGSSRSREVSSRVSKVRLSPANSYPRCFRAWSTYQVSTFNALEITSQGLGPSLHYWLQVWVSRRKSGFRHFHWFTWPRQRRVTCYSSTPWWSQDIKRVATPNCEA